MPRRVAIGVPPQRTAAVKAEGLPDRERRNGAEGRARAAGNSGALHGLSLDLGIERIAAVHLPRQGQRQSAVAAEIAVCEPVSLEGRGDQFELIGVVQDIKVEHGCGTLELGKRAREFRIDAQPCCGVTELQPVFEALRQCAEALGRVGILCGIKVLGVAECQDTVPLTVNRAGKQAVTLPLACPLERVAQDSDQLRVQFHPLARGMVHTCQVIERRIFILRIKQLVSAFERGAVAERYTLQLTLDLVAAAGEVIAQPDPALIEGGLLVLAADDGLIALLFRAELAHAARKEEYGRSKCENKGRDPQPELSGVQFLFHGWSPRKRTAGRLRSAVQL